MGIVFLDIVNARPDIHRFKVWKVLPDPGHLIFPDNAAGVRMSLNPTLKSIGKSAFPFLNIVHLLIVHFYVSGFEREFG
jgi:hypothetical protein